MRERRVRDLAIMAAGVAVAVAAVTPLVLHWLTNPPDQRMVDLDVYRSGGQAVLRGAPVYDFLTQPPQLLPFTYPPFAVLLAVPLAMVPWAAIQWVWAALILLALAITVRYAFAGVLDRAGRWAPLLAGVLVALCAYPMPLRDQIRFGQVDVFLVAMCAADCCAPRTRWPRGLLAGLATAIKLVPGVFIVYFWVTGRRREAVTAAVTAAAATLGTFLVLPADSADYWFRALFDSDRLGANNGTTNQSIRGMLLRLYWPDAVTSALWLACAAVVAYLGFRAARRVAAVGREIDGADAGPVGRADGRGGPGGRPGPGGRVAGGTGPHRDEVAGVAITGLIAVLVSPVSWIHHLAWLVVVLGALAGTGRGRWGAGVAAVAWLYYVLEIPWWGITMLAHHIGPRFAGRIVQDAYGLGALILLLILSRRPSGGKRSSTDSQSGGLNTSRGEPQVGTLGT